MVQVKAPLAQASVAILAQLAVEVVREVMKHDHEIDHPQPAHVAPGQIAKRYHQDGPRRRQ